MKLDISMKWQQVAAMAAVLLQNGSKKGRNQARAELQKMARAADLSGELLDALRRARTMQRSGIYHHVTAPAEAAARCTCPSCVYEAIDAVLAKVKQ